MNELELKYGCNPNQKPARVFMTGNKDLPFRVLNGKPGYINLLDALNAWQLVGELKGTLNKAAAASFKHVSPSGAAIGRPMSERLQKASFVSDIPGLSESSVALAYARARGTDRMSSYGDFAALSEVCDETTAMILKREVSDGVIAPGYTDKALEILKSKKQGNYVILKMDSEYVPDEKEQKQVFGVTFEQGRNNYKVENDTFANIVSKNKDLNEEAIINLTVALITLKYTQSNSVCYAFDGQTIGVGAGQQSRIHCTRLAGSKADAWLMRQSDAALNLPFREDIRRPDRDNAIDRYLSNESEEVKELLSDGNWEQYFTVRPTALSWEDRKTYLDGIQGVALASDAFFPFGDNIERAKRSGVSYVVEPGGSIRDDNVIETADKYKMVMCFTGMRLFHH